MAHYFICIQPCSSDLIRIKSIGIPFLSATLAQPSVVLRDPLVRAVGAPPLNVNPAFTPKYQMLLSFWAMERRLFNEKNKTKNRGLIPYKNNQS